MKRFENFTEDVNKVAALKAKQKAAVAKFKSTSASPKPQSDERKVHSGDIETQNMIDAKRAKQKAAARKAEIRAEIQSEKQDK
mgnify:FL=1